MANLIVVEGIGDEYARRLKAAGIVTTEALLERGATPQDRRQLAEETGISAKLILEWVNQVDLFRIKGVGGEYADLLEVAGVDTVPELAQRNAGNVYKSLVATNKQKKIVRRLPGRKQVTDWVDQAKALPRVIKY